MRAPDVCCLQTVAVLAAVQFRALLRISEPALLTEGLTAAAGLESRQ